MKKTPATISNTPEYWGAIGGKARAAKLTPERRSAIAKKAAKARWAKHRKARPPTQESAA